MRKVKGFHPPSMAAKGLSHFFQKDKVIFWCLHHLMSFQIELKVRQVSASLILQVFVLLLWDDFAVIVRDRVDRTHFVLVLTSCLINHFYLLDVPSQKKT